MAETPPVATPARLADPVPGILTSASFNLFAGASGAGKSSLLCLMIRAMLEDQPFFGHLTERPPAVAWVSMDRPWRDTQALFDMYGVPRGVVPLHGWSRIDHPHFLPVPELWKASQVPGNLAACFLKIVDQFHLPEGSLIVIDPGPTLIGSDQNQYTRMALGMMALYDVINLPNRQYCVIATDHPAKQSVDARSGYRRIEDRIGGSAGKGAHANTLMYIAEPKELKDDQLTHIFYWKPRRAKSEQFGLIRNAAGLLEPTDLNHQVAEPQPNLPPELQSVWEVVPRFPAFIRWPELLKQFGDRGKRTLERQLKDLIQGQHVIRLGQGCYARPPLA